MGTGDKTDVRGDAQLLPFAVRQQEVGDSGAREEKSLGLVQDCKVIWCSVITRQFFSDDDTQIAPQIRPGRLSR